MTFGFANQPSPVIEAIRAAGHGGIHNFSLGTLTTYFRLETAQVTFDDGVLILDGLPGSARRKVFVFAGAACPKEELLKLQRTSVIYSQQEIGLPKGSPFKEAAYKLSEVFSPASYPNARKRSKRLLQPFSRLVKAGIELRLLGEGDLPQIRRLHDAWCEHKLSLPTTFKMMFPKQRYFKCMDIAVARKSYAPLGAFLGDEMIGARALYVDGSTAFDLACFTASWATYSNFSEDFNIWCLRALHQSDVEIVNCGSGLSKQLSAFKHHWPHFTVASWAYSKLSGDATNQ